MANVSVHAGGHTILEAINLKIEPGDHVAIVGVSGAGKSSLLGLLLGWHRAAAGSVLVDGAVVEGAQLEQLRQRTAWIDPAVQLWNRSLFANLCYGNSDGVPTADLLEQAELRQLLEKLPDGLQTELGESGGLVSGGEGQRVRFGRALLKRGVGLALLDEPFRGLDRHQRRELLARARRHWANTTLLCVTHDVGETLTFPRVLVVENGQSGGACATAKFPLSSASGRRRECAGRIMVRQPVAALAPGRWPPDRRVAMGPGVTG
jgi:ATP-binding cassette subfamily B protein